MPPVPPLPQVEANPSLGNKPTPPDKPIPEHADTQTVVDIDRGTPCVREGEDATNEAKGGGAGLPTFANVFEQRQFDEAVERAAFNKLMADKREQAMREMQKQTAFLHKTIPEHDPERYIVPAPEAGAGAQGTTEQHVPTQGTRAGGATQGQARPTQGTQGAAVPTQGTTPPAVACASGTTEPQVAIGGAIAGGLSNAGVPRGPTKPKSLLDPELIKRVVDASCPTDVPIKDRNKLYAAMGRSVKGDSVPAACVARYTTERQTTNGMFKLLQEWVQDPTWGKVTVLESHRRIILKHISMEGTFVPHPNETHSSKHKSRNQSVCTGLQIEGHNPNI